MFLEVKTFLWLELYEKDSQIIVKVTIWKVLIITIIIIAPFNNTLITTEVIYRV